jgi:hypothetical protein
MTWSPEAVDAALVQGVALWNVYALPAVLAAVAVVSLVRGRGGGVGDARPWADPRRVVRRVGLMHYGLALWSLTTVASELWAARAMGVLPSNPVTGLFGSTLALLIDAPLGAGLRGFWRGARWGAVVVAAFRTVVAAWVTAFSRQFGAVVDLDEWPRYAVARALPPFLLFVLLLPSTARAFRSRDATPPAPAPGPFGAAVALISRLFLVVVASVVVTDAVDAAARAAVEWAAGDGG